MGRPWVAVIAAFAVAVALHSPWDATDSIPARVAIALLGGTLLAAQIRQVRRDTGGG